VPAAGVRRDAPRPFETPPVRPRGRASSLTRKYVERPTDRQGDDGTEGAQVLGDERFLTLPKADEDDACT